MKNGRPFLCWAHILGRSTFSKCQFKNGHVPENAIPDKFAEDIVTMLTLGVNAVVARASDQEGSPAKRRRGDKQQA